MFLKILNSKLVSDREANVYLLSLSFDTIKIPSYQIVENFGRKFCGSNLKRFKFITTWTTGQGKFTLDQPCNNWFTNPLWSIFDVKDHHPNKTSYVIFPLNV